MFQWANGHGVTWIMAVSW